MPDEPQPLTELVALPETTNTAEKEVGELLGIVGREALRMGPRGRDLCFSVTSPASVWSDWNAGTTSASTLNTWTIWNSGTTFSGTGSLTLTNREIWAHWGANADQPRIYTAPPGESPEQRQSRLQHAIEIEGERAKARERAELLLRESLSPKQLEELQARGHFHLDVLGANGSRRTYRINRGRSRNVQLIEGGRVIKTLCAHPIELVPDADTMLAQKLFLECSEEEFLRVANHS